MKLFEVPEIEIIKLGLVDVITTSEDLNLGGLGDGNVGGEIFD